MNKAYSYQGADELIPLLRSIQREVRERRDEILRLENTARVFKRRAKDHPRLASLQAELAASARRVRWREQAKRRF